MTSRIRRLPTPISGVVRHQLLLSTQRPAATPQTSTSCSLPPAVLSNKPAQRYNHQHRSYFSTAAHLHALPPTFLTNLQSDLPQLSISTNVYDLESHGKGESFHPTARPDAVLTPTNTQEVVTILNHCLEHKVPVIPFGVGTSLEGHVAAIEGGISLDMSQFINIDLPTDGQLADAYVKVGTGVTRLALNDALRHTGMQFMVDPGADATIGGMVACGASGTAAVKYGTMRDNVLGLECVLADGTVAQCGTNALKSSAGYDLVGLMTGSEGTLGVITSVTVKLHPIPANVTAAVCCFETLHDAAEAVSTILMCGVPVERCELLDVSSIGAFNRYAMSHGYEGGDMELKPTLFLEFSGPSEAAVDEQVQMTQSICSDDYGAADFRFTSNESERKHLWSARHKLYYASINSRPGAKSALVTDACVPLSKFADLVTATAEDVKTEDVVGFNFGHAGDGNFHCILPLCEDDGKDYLERVHRVNDNLIQRTIEAGGTCTGEHGIGYGKMKYLPKQYGEGGVEFMRKIKKAIDPANIMNPGKIVEV